MQRTAAAVDWRDRLVHKLLTWRDRVCLGLDIEHDATWRKTRRRHAIAGSSEVRRCVAARRRHVCQQSVERMRAVLRVCTLAYVRASTVRSSASLRMNDERARTSSPVCQSRMRDESHVLAT